MKNEVKAKEKSIQIMNKLNICEDFVSMYKEHGKEYVCYYDNGFGYWVFQNQELFDKMKEIEESKNCICYAIVHTFTDFGELYDFLLVDEYEEDWDSIIYDYDDNIKGAFTYCWNKTNDICSEFSRAYIVNRFGGLVRVG